MTLHYSTVHYIHTIDFLLSDQIYKLLLSGSMGLNLDGIIHQIEGGRHLLPWLFHVFTCAAAEKSG